jgi:hypothetical protein
MAARLRPARIPALESQKTLAQLLCARSLVPRSHLHSPRGDTSRCAVPFSTEWVKGRAMLRCLPGRCFPVTARADPDLAFVPVHVMVASAARTAPGRRHPSRQHRRFAGNGMSGSACPKPPTHPQCSTPSIPKGSAPGNSLLAALDCISRRSDRRIGPQRLFVQVLFCWSGPGALTSRPTDRRAARGSS